MYDTGIKMLKDNPLSVFPLYYIFYIWTRIVGAQRGRGGGGGGGGWI